ncbi:MAG TPA: polysaccharide ABC transporter ATP-binding protein [Candidatus Obscuribacterales bacterium]
MSSNSSAIVTSNLTKYYSIGTTACKRSSAAEAIADWIKNPLRHNTTGTFCALSDLSCEISSGSIVGILGRNGAGKSTLLKILSRITEPSHGIAELYGRVGSLLEVGTGFHPELTGRENIFLNGTILGMSRTDIKRQFDEIVEFAGVEKFLDTPVKRYSSGMYVRLAFSVAAHLESEILLIDEILAVGDAEFQKKCLGRMKSVATSGRTILFVSHNMQSIAALCDKSMLLDGGRLSYYGDVKSGIDKYLQSYCPQNNVDLAQPESRRGSGEYRLAYMSPVRQMFGGADLKEFEFRIDRRHGTAGQMFMQSYIYNSAGVIVCQCDSRLTGFWIGDTQRIEGKFSFRTPWLKPGTYRMDVVISNAFSLIDDCQGAAVFDVSPGIPYGFTAGDDSLEYGIVFSDFQWSQCGPLSTAREGYHGAMPGEPARIGIGNGRHV